MNRAMGGSEYIAWSLDRAKTINFVTIVQITGPLEPEALRRALDLLQKRHPMLSARIVEEGVERSFVFGEAPPVPLGGTPPRRHAVAGGGRG